MTPGLFDGFEGYRSTTEALKTEAVTSWLVVLDTNVLLNLYNFQGQTLREFTEVFSALGDRLFVPHQVIDEFWRNRRRALSENQGKHRERQQVEEGLAAAETAFSRWHRRVVDRVADPDQGALRELTEARDALTSFMDEQTEQNQSTKPDTPTHDDQVIAHLEPLLAGRVGPPTDPGQVADLIKQGRERLAAKVPPGYMDGDKNPERAIGDFLVWRQTMDEAQARGLSVLMITNDQKDDWWADAGTPSMRARPELVRELLDTTGQRLLMMRSRDLVELGGAVGVAVSASTLSEASLAADDVGAWTEKLAHGYFDYLLGWPAYYDVLVEAVRGNGRISRERMAELLGKDADASMKGSGRPFVTALRRVSEYYELTTDLPVPLAAEYGDGGWMTHFVMPPGLSTLFADAIVTYEPEPD